MPWPQVQCREVTDRGAAAGLDGTAEAVAMLAARATENDISIISGSISGLHNPPRSISSSGLHNSPCNSSSRINISGSHSSSSSARRDTLAGGDHRVCVSVAARLDISMQNVERYLPRR